MVVTELRLPYKVGRSLHFTSSSESVVPVSCLVPKRFIPELTIALPLPSVPAFSTGEGEIRFVTDLGQAPEASMFLQVGKASILL